MRAENKYKSVHAKTRAKLQLFFTLDKLDATKRRKSTNVE